MNPAETPRSLPNRTRPARAVQPLKQPGNAAGTRTLRLLQISFTNLGWRRTAPTPLCILKPGVFRINSMVSLGPPLAHGPRAETPSDGAQLALIAGRLCSAEGAVEAVKPGNRVFVG